MPRFSVIEQQVAATAPRVDTGATLQGAALSDLGQSIQGVGAALADVEIRARNRSDVIDRVRQMNAFDEQAMQTRQETLDGSDITDPATVAAYKNQLKTQMDGLLSSHTGLPESKATLRAALEQSYGNATKQVMADHLRAQQTLILNNVQDVTNTLSSVTAESPGAIDDALEELDVRIDELAPALSGEQEGEYRRQGRASIITSAITSYLERGDYVTAKTLMDHEGYAKVLSPSVSRKLRLDASVVESKSIQREQAFNDRVAQYSLLTRRKLSDEEVARIRTLPDKPSEMTAADKISEYELVTGHPASQSVVDKMFNADTSSRFGESLRGRSLQTVNENLFSYASGTLSKQDAIEFQSAVFEAYGSKEYVDPATGARSSAQASMPPAVRQALDAGAGTYGDVDVGGFSSRVKDDGTQGMDALEGESLWDTADSVSGPFSAAGRAAFELTGVGSPEHQKAASTANWLRENIVAGIRPEGRIANQYRQELMTLVDIQPKIFRSDTAYRHKLVDMDTKLRQRLSDLRKIVDGDSFDSTVAERRDAITLSHNIEQALARLRVRRVQKPDDAAKLPEGTWFVNPHGEVLQVPSRGSADAKQ